MNDSMTVLATTTLVPAALFSDKKFSLTVIRQNDFVPVASKCPGQTFRFSKRPARTRSNDDQGMRWQFPKERFNGISAEVDVPLQFVAAPADGFGKLAN